jgi:hypothetical protein
VLIGGLTAAAVDTAAIARGRALDRADAPQVPVGADS